MEDIGVIHGRFQVLHNDHLRYLLAGAGKCRRLVVGITNPEPSLTEEDPADPERSDPAANPLTYWERYTMVRAVLTASGVAESDLSVVPLPINFPDRFRFYVPLDALFFLTIYDEWGRRKRDRFRELGLRTNVLWELPPEEKGITGREVRRRMIAGEPWAEMVPPETARLAREWGLADRLRGGAASAG
jgi:nicotinamide-nucleotide adenylyltransferase